MQLARVQMFNLTNNKLLVHVRYKRIMQVQSNLELAAQFITGLEMTRCQLTSKVS